MKRFGKSTVRTRLTVLVAGLIVLTGAVLLVASYFLVRGNLATASITLGNSNRRTGWPTVRAAATGAAPRGSSVIPATARAVGRVRTELAHHTLAALVVQYGLILAALALVGLVSAWVIAGRLLRPLRVITAAAERMTRDHLGERLALSGPSDELKVLGDTFDSMLSRLEVAFEDQQLFAASAAHELRTPLTILRAELDLAANATYGAPDGREGLLIARLSATVKNCEVLVERLLTLTQGDLAVSELETVALDDLVRAELVSNQLALTSGAVVLQTDLRSARTHGDASLLAQLVANLIDNAFKYSDGRWVSVTTQTDGADAVLEVANGGRQLLRDDVARLIEPFQRAGTPRVGRSVGLGLSIVRSITRAHEGTLVLEPLEDGGLTVRITLPATDGLTTRVSPGRAIDPKGERATSVPSE